MLPKRVVAAIAGMAALSAAPGFTQPIESAELTLSDPAPKSEYIIDGAWWTCEGVSCRSAAVASLPPVVACIHMVEETGAAASLTWRGRTLTNDELTACNARARKPKVSR